MNITLNYNHLYYFWLVVKEMSVTKAAGILSISQPSLSAQLKTFQENIGYRLLERDGRNIKLTPDGEIVYQYADNIFKTAGELVDVLKKNTLTNVARLKVGITNSLPKYIATRILMPLIDEREILIECYEGQREYLYSKLGDYSFDVVLTDAPFASEVAVKAYNHYLGSSKVSLYGTKKFAKKNISLSSLSKIPMLLPTKNIMVRRNIDSWLEKNNINPFVPIEFEDSALLKSFAANGSGIVPLVDSVQDEVRKTYKIYKILELEGVKEDFYAVSLERKVKNPIINRLVESVNFFFNKK